MCKRRAAMLSTDAAVSLSCTVLSLAALGAGCAAKDPFDLADPADTSVVERAAEVMRRASYISFDYSANGCHDRSILMAAELAAAGIPSNAQFLVAANGDGNLLRPAPYPELEWNYHVAPVIFVSDAPSSARDPMLLMIQAGEVVGEIDPDAYIVDPALYPDDIVALLRTWVDDLTGQEQDGFLSLNDAREALDVPLDLAKAEADTASTVIPASLDEMPRLWQFQLGSSCGFLSRDAGELEPEIGREGVEAIRRAMDEGALALLERMLDLDLLLETESVPRHLCWDFNE